jgi:hypothetical protein
VEGLAPAAYDDIFLVCAWLLALEDGHFLVRKSLPEAADFSIILGSCSSMRGGGLT